MAFFNRFRIPRTPRQPDPGDCHELSRVGDDPALWDALDEAALRQVLAIKFLDYLDVIRPRLEALEAEESEPKVIPRIFEMWEDPEASLGACGAEN